MSRSSERHRDPGAVAYLCSAYPAVSHTFVLREVQALRRLGVDVQTFTVRRTPPQGLLSDGDRAEAARTHHLLPTSAAVLLRAVLSLLRTGRGRRAVGVAARTAWSLRRPGLRGHLWQLFYLLEAILLWAECSRRGIRHVHAHFANVASEVAPLTVTIGNEVDPHNPMSWSLTMHGPSDFIAPGFHQLAYKAASARFIACISDFGRSQLMAVTEPHLWDRIHVVHCGLDLERYAFSPPEQPPADTVPRVLTVGRLVPVKGQALIVEAIDRLRSRGIDVQAEIVGEGPMRAALQRSIAEYGLERQVTLCGALNQDQVAERIRGATVFLLPSFAEGVPVVAMEAMALGVPVITSRIAGIPELIEDGVSGLLTTPSRLDEIVAALERLLADPELRRRMAVTARATIVAEFDSDQEARKVASLFPASCQPVSLRTVSDSSQALAVP